MFFLYLLILFLINKLINVLFYLLSAHKCVSEGDMWELVLFFHLWVSSVKLQSSDLMEVFEPSEPFQSPLFCLFKS